METEDRKVVEMTLKERIELTCQNCEKIYTRECPIRVWGRNEENDLRLDSKVNPTKDYCSRMIVRIIPPELGVNYEE
ncbi:MAG: hypothetical protein KKB31_06385 [Nanoarchaeota archaeon]|nr:hypothetical protein [Nanoarchaeota archaeon]